MIIENRHKWQLIRRETVRRIYVCVFCWVVPARLEELPTLHPVCDLSLGTQFILIVIHMTAIVNMETMVTCDIV
jgi:hypothetical protein